MSISFVSATLKPEATVAGYHPTLYSNTIRPLNDGGSMLSFYLLTAPFLNIVQAGGTSALAGDYAIYVGSDSGQTAKSIYIYGGTGNATKPQGNVILANSGTSARGKVGIGTGSPTEMLEVNGNVKATAFIGDGSQLTGISTGGSSQWSSQTGGIAYGDTTTTAGSEPVYVHAGGAQLIVSNGYYDGAAGVWKRFKPGYASGILYSDSGLSLIGAEYNDTANSNIAWNTAAVVSPDGKLGVGTQYPSEKLSVVGTAKFDNKIKAQGGIHVGQVTEAAEQGDLSFSDAALKYYDGTNWKALGDAFWIGCPLGICYKGTTSAPATTTVWPVANTAYVFAGTSGTSQSTQYLAVQDNNNYITTIDSQQSTGIYQFNNINLPLGANVDSVTVSAYCKLEASTQYAGDVALALYDGSTIKYSSTHDVTSTNSNWFTFTKTQNPWTGQSWTASEVSSLKAGVIGTGGTTAFCDEPLASLIGTSLVLMSDGTHKQIKDVVIGDEIKSYDLQSNQFVTTKVKRTFVEHKSVLTINKKLTLSPDHKVYTQNKGYSLAGDLEIGDLLVREDGTLEEITSISDTTQENETVYDVLLESPNNFFAEGYLVHNVGPSCTYTYQDLQCSRIKVSVAYSDSEYKAILTQSGDLKIQRNINAGNFTSDTGVTAQTIKSNYANISQIDSDIVDVTTVNAQTVQTGQLDVVSVNHVSGQKFCSVVASGNWRDTVPLPYNAQWTACRDLMNLHGGTYYNLECQSSSGTFSKSADFTSAPTSYPSPDCGWADGEALINAQHTTNQCTSAGGTLFTVGTSGKACKFSGSSCPSGWSYLPSWSATTSTTSPSGTSTCDENGVCCNAQCTTGGHTFDNHWIEGCSYGPSYGTCSYIEATKYQVGCY